MTWKQNFSNSFHSLRNAKHDVRRKALIGKWFCFIETGSFFESIRASIFVSQLRKLISSVEILLCFHFELLITAWLSLTQNFWLILKTLDVLWLRFESNGFLWKSSHFLPHYTGFQNTHNLFYYSRSHSLYLVGYCALSLWNACFIVRNPSFVAC